MPEVETGTSLMAAGGMAKSVTNSRTMLDGARQGEKGEGLCLDTGVA
jgi:hypothetical protein